MSQELYYQIALSLTPNIGAVKAKSLIDHFGTAENVFTASVKEMMSLENIGKIVSDSIKKFNDRKIVEEEIAFIEKYKIKTLFITDEAYPKRLLNCYDPPTLLYFKGNVNFNTEKTISIVGTRNNTVYGKEITEKIVEELSDKNITIISGLATGIDVIAHKAAVKNKIATIGVMGNGLKTIYPSTSKSIATEMLENGGVLTEFTHTTKPDKHNFPKRNRIVAGMSDAVIVIETSVKGGSMITAEIANGYNRDVFAVPGKVTDSKSAGCNYLIQNNKAFLFSSVNDFLFMMGWNEEQQVNKKKKQAEIFYTLSEDEKIIVDILREKENVHIDAITVQSGFTSSKLAAVMLQLELQNIIKSLPGKLFTLY